MRIILFTFVWLLSLTASAQRDTTARTVGKQVFAADTLRPALRKPDPAVWKGIREAREYQYKQDVRPPSGLLEELWQRFLNWLVEFLYSPDTRKGREWVQILFVIGVVSFFIYRIAGMEKVGLFGRKSQTPALPYEAFHEDIHGMDFEDAIGLAVAAHNYRLGVRLLYLRSLKRLADRGLISWQIDKTNRAYVYEVTQPEIRPAFERLTSLFEYVWYGDFPVRETDFSDVKREFETFEKAV